MNTKLSRNLQFIFAVSYAAFLIAGAIPRQWLPKSWQPAMYQFSQFQTHSVRIMPGIGVFNFTESLNPFQPVSSCIEVQVKTADGKVKAFTDFPCPLRKGAYSLLQDTSRIFYMNLAGAGSGVEPTQNDSLPVLATAEYFCRKFDGQTAIIRFPVRYQNLMNGILMDWPTRSHVVDCAILRARHTSS